MSIEVDESALHLGGLAEYGSDGLWVGGDGSAALLCVALVEFLLAGLALGLLGSGLGLILGMVFVRHINTLASWLSQVMGHDVFHPEVYNFYEVPAIIEPWTVVWIVVGSVLIAVVSGVIPALRAARLRPVDALRV